MQRQQIALLGRLDRNEVHGGPLHRLGDGLRIAVVVLVTLEEGLHVLCRDQANVMSECLDLARDVMRARASLQADKAGRQIDKSADKLAARYFDVQGDRAALVEADEVESTCRLTVSMLVPCESPAVARQANIVPSHCQRGLR